MSDGVALFAAPHPVDDSVLEFCRAHKGAMGAVPTTPEGCAMIARLINEYLFLAEGDINEDALETVEIELPARPMAVHDDNEDELKELERYLGSYLESLGIASPSADIGALSIMDHITAEFCLVRRLEETR